VSGQRLLCSTAPSLPWVAWASLPHLPRSYAPLRLPPPRLGVLHLSLVPRYLACFHRSWSPLRARSREEAPGHARAFGHPVPHSGSTTRRQAALPSSPVPPLKTCPALRPRWCPAHSPQRTQDCCLPATGHRRLPTTLPFSGLHHAACLLATPGFVRPLTGRHAGSLLTCWLGVDQVGLEPYGLAPTGKRQPISWACAQCQGCGLTLARPLPGSAWPGPTVMPHPSTSLLWAVYHTQGIEGSGPVTSGGRTCSTLQLLADDTA
jgi:hypothetical protein